MDTTSRPSLPEPDPDQRINAVIHGPVHGQVAIGEHIYQNMWHIHGDLIVRAASPRQSPRARRRPVYQVPRVFPGLLDRQTELSSAISTVLSGEPVEIHGEQGVGKTSLLRSLAHHETSGSFRDGVVWIRASAHPAMDLLQVLFEAFYEWDVPSKPTEGQMRQALRSIQALVLCDDVRLTREDLEMVLDMAPECSFLVTTDARLLWSLGRSISLMGLPASESLTLIEREFGRALLDDERDACAVLHKALGGHPLRLLQATALVRAGDTEFAAIASRIRDGGTATGLTDHVTSPLAETERRMLAVVSAFAGAPVRSSLAGVVSGIHEPEPALDVLMDRHLVTRQSAGMSGDGYATVGAADREQLPELDQVREQALERITTWAEEHRGDPHLVLQDADAALAMFRWASDSGRWADVVRLGRALNGALALGLRWGNWSFLLGATLQAARELGSAGDVAWARHQMGTRAACMGNQAAARAALTEALRIRVDQGDREGAAVTRHNLNMLAPPPPPARTEPVARKHVQPKPAPAVPLPVRHRSHHARFPITLVLLAALGGGAWFTLARDDPVLETPTPLFETPAATIDDRIVDPPTVPPTISPTVPPTIPPTVEPANTTISITVMLDDVSKVYGDADPALTYSVSGGDGDVTVTGAPERDPGENVGTYAIRRGSLSIVGPGYELSVVEGTFTINARPITVVANPQTRQFDTSDPPLTYSVSGGDVGITGSLVRDPGEEVGSYTIRQGSLAVPDPNYSLAFIESTLTITEPPEGGGGDGDITIPGRDPVPEETQEIAPQNESEPVSTPGDGAVE